MTAILPQFRHCDCGMCEWLNFGTFFKFPCIVRIYAWFFMHCRNHHSDSHTNHVIIFYNGWSIQRNKPRCQNHGIGLFGFVCSVRINLLYKRLGIHMFMCLYACLPVCMITNIKSLESYLNWSTTAVLRNENVDCHLRLLRESFR